MSEPDALVMAEAQQAALDERNERDAMADRMLVREMERRDERLERALDGDGEENTSDRLRGTIVALEARVADLERQLADAHDSDRE